ncbi:MAG TPA: hypothetical protein VK791_08970 [bacterium]|nr:hypothetical protein [bacterium]
MKKLCFALLLIIAPLAVYAETPGDYFFANYDIIDLDFLRTHYFEIDNGRAIQFEGSYQSMKWLEPFAYKERLSRIDFDVNQYNLIQFSLKEKDDINYAFPILLFHSLTGDLNELKQLAKGDRIRIYGRFYKLKEADFSVEVDVIETIKKGGHETDMILDGRVSPTPTPTFTPTPTPGPSLWKRMSDLVNPKETVVPTGTVTPDAQ